MFTFFGIKEKVGSSKIKIWDVDGSYFGTGDIFKGSYSPPKTVFYSGCSKCGV